VNFASSKWNYLRAWPLKEPTWGIFGIPDTVAGLLPKNLIGVEAVELGCGTAYVSAWLARRGARPVGTDPTAGQLSMAREFQDHFALHFPLVLAAAEQLPFRDGSFDLAISEYGAAIWSDPHPWIPEAARLLRPGGELVLLGTSTLLMLCVPDEEGLPAGNRLLRRQFGMHRFEWPDDPTVEFHLSHGDWIRLMEAPTTWARARSSSGSWMRSTPLLSLAAMSLFVFALCPRTACPVRRGELAKDQPRQPRSAALGNLRDPGLVTPTVSLSPAPYPTATPAAATPTFPKCSFPAVDTPTFGC
jgi:SAM-dependent methyltransferase